MPATRTEATTASPTRGDDDIIAEGTKEWRKASALMDAACNLSNRLEEDLPARFAEMLDFVLERLPESEQQGREDNG